MQHRSPKVALKADDLRSNWQQEDPGTNVEPQLLSQFLQLLDLLKLMGSSMLSHDCLHGEYCEPSWPE